MKFENRVQRYQHLFTKTDKRIVNYIRQNGYSDAFSTINSLAHAIGTSPTTMTRFSHKLDYENFQDLKFNIQQEMTEKVRFENSPIIQRIHKYHQQIIQQTGEFIHNDIIQTFIDKLQSSRHILFVDEVALVYQRLNFDHRMIRMGLKGNVTTDSHFMKISRTFAPSHSDMFIAMSNSGNTSELISAAEVAKSHGAYVVAITNFEGSTYRLCRFSTFNNGSIGNTCDLSIYQHTNCDTLFNRYRELSFIRKYKSESNLSTY